MEPGDGLNIPLVKPKLPQSLKHKLSVYRAVRLMKIEEENDAAIDGLHILLT